MRPDISGRTKYSDRVLLRGQSSDLEASDVNLGRRISSSNLISSIVIGGYFQIASAGGGKSELTQKLLHDPAEIIVGFDRRIFAEAPNNGLAVGAQLYFSSLLV